MESPQFAVTKKVCARLSAFLQLFLELTFFTGIFIKAIFKSEGILISWRRSVS